MYWIKKYPLLEVLYHSLYLYPVPINLTYLWNFGVLALLCLAIQIITGIFLAMHYTAHVDLAFLSIEHIMRDVNYGWLFRYIHANGASAFFFVVYVHMFRGLYYGSYVHPREWLWGVGVIIFLLMILTAFMGYVLPWGQMSFWAATVITNLASAVPFCGDLIVKWLWGGFSVDNATLNRFFSLHYFLPFVIAFLVVIHLVLLHQFRSNNPLGVNTVDSLFFAPYFTLKDLVGAIIFFQIFFLFVYFAPNLAGHSDNYIPANPLVTPTHIVPEWYFLPFYAILRSVPNKLGGVVLMLLAILVLFFFPFLTKQLVCSNRFRPLHKSVYWFFVFNCVLLGWIGGKSIETPFYEIGQVATLFYFVYFIILIPILNKIERFFML